MDDSLHIVFDHNSYQVCLDRQFVLQSRDIESKVIQTDLTYAIVVRSSQLMQAQAELNAYVEENIVDAPQPSNIEPPALEFKPALIGYVLLLSVIAGMAGMGLFNLDWYQQGRIDTAQIQSGEWWRLFTALTLHANAQHLLSNLGFGLLFLYYFSRHMGYGIASFLVLLSGVMGNAVNVYVQGSAHLSIGASTAVFGVLGMLSAYVWKMKYYSQVSWPKRLAPIFGGIALLAFTGTSGENTDLGAHLWGFVSGILLGWLSAQFRETLLGIHPKIQMSLLLLTLFSVVLSWGLALN